MILVAESQVLVGSAAVVSVTIRDQDGSAVDPASPVTVKVYSVGGAVHLPTNTATTTGVSVGYRSVSLPSSAVASLGFLLLEWSVAGPVVVTSVVEVVGGFWASEMEIRKQSSFLSDSKITKEAILQVRSECTHLFENTTHTAGRPRFGGATVSGRGSSILVLPDPFIRKVRSVSCMVAGSWVVWGSTDLARVQFNDSGILYLSTGVWQAGVFNIKVEYEHGMDQPYPDLKRAWFRWVTHELAATKSNIPDRATSMVDSGTGATFRIATAGQGAAITGIGDIDEVIKRRTFDLGMIK